MPGLRLASVYVDVATRLQGLYSGLTRANRVVDRFAAGMMAKGRSMMLLGGMLSAPFILSTKAAMGFEDQMARVSTMLSTQTMDLLPGMTEGVRGLAVEMGQSTKTLTDGLYAILSAQVPAAQAMEYLGSASDAAVAGISDVGTTVLALTKVMIAFEDQLKGVTDASDFMFTIVKQGQGTFGDFAGAIPRVTAVAALAGLRIEEMGAAVATASRQLGNARRTTFALSAMLMQFLKPGRDAIKVARKYGFEMNTATLRTIGLIGVLRKLRKAAPEEVAKIFPMRAYRGIAVLLRDTTGYLRDLEVMYKRTGATQEALAKRVSTAAFQWARLREMVKGVGVEIGYALIPIFVRVIKVLQSYYERVRDWIKENRVWIQTAAKVTVGIFALGAAFYAVGFAIKAIKMGAIIGLFALLGVAIEKAVKALTGIELGFTRAVGDIRIGSHKIRDWMIFIQIEAVKFSERIKSWWGGFWEKLQMDILIRLFIFRKKLGIWAQMLWEKVKIEFIRGGTNIGKITEVIGRELVRALPLPEGMESVLLKGIQSQANIRDRIMGGMEKKYEQRMKKLTDASINADRVLHAALDISAKRHQARELDRLKELEDKIKGLSELQKRYMQLTALPATPGAKAAIEDIKQERKDAETAFNRLLQSFGMAGALGRGIMGTLFVSPWMQPPKGPWRAGGGDPILSELQKQTQTLEDIEEGLQLGLAP